MAKIDFTMTDLQATRLGYDEGQDVTPEVLKRAKKSYRVFQDKYSSLKAQLIEFPDIHYYFMAHDTSLEYFYNRAKNMVAHGTTDSLDIFGCYLEYIDTYNELFDLIKNDFMLDCDKIGYS
ncbi:hypothetical protein [Leuconostoc citreum]|uniref:hypothetical protein n=1 Tax=Leuconostoc citreum TaxID=33964 RepID=UPI000BFEFD34|nr:hypothetical protein [Leuconostoc citreum]